MIADTTCAVLRALCCAPADPAGFPIGRRLVRKFISWPFVSGWTGTRRLRGTHAGLLID